VNQSHVRQGGRGGKDRELGKGDNAGPERVPERGESKQDSTRRERTWRSTVKSRVKLEAEESSKGSAKS